MVFGLMCFSYTWMYGYVSQEISSFQELFPAYPVYRASLCRLMKSIYLSDFEAMESLARVRFANSLPGPKPICLIGSIDSEGRTNLAPFSTVTHLGSNPALIGLVSRPDLVERHTLSNIFATRSYTINHVHVEILEAAHHCSARYPREMSEFTAAGLTPHFEKNVAAPFVAESRLRFALELEETISIKSNGTILIIGKVVLAQLPAEHYGEDGSIDLTALGSMASTALDTYFELGPPIRLPYAKPR